MDAQKINKTLCSIGKGIFIKIYPLLKSKPNLDVDDLVKTIPDYKNFSPGSQKSRLSHARTIINKGWEKEALENISLSSKLNPEDIELASKYLKEL